MAICNGILFTRSFPFLKRGYKITNIIEDLWNPYANAQNNRYLYIFFSKIYREPNSQMQIAISCRIVFIHDPNNPFVNKKKAKKGNK